MAPTTPDEWLPILARKLDERAAGTDDCPSMATLRSYCNGKAPLPEMGRNVKESWKAFQKKARVNYGGLAVRALKNRIRPNGLRVGNDEADPIVAVARRIWRDNRLDTQIALAVRDRLEVRVGYLVVGRDADMKAVITREKPEFFIAVTDPLRPWKAVAGAKIWRDLPAGLDFMWVYVRGSRQKYRRASKDSNGIVYARAVSESWVQDGDPETYDGAPPIIVMERPDGQALLEPHLDVIDSINLGKLQRLVITAMQAFKQRGIKGDLPEKDEEGNDIDWAKVFDPAPGALWDLPAGIDVWESEQTDIRPLLEGEKADRRDFAAVTSTPLSVFVPEGENQSAEGAANAKEGHVSLAQDEIDDIKPGIAMALVYALRYEEQDLGDKTVEVDFAPPALVSLTEKYTAAGQAKSAGLARKTILRDIIGMSPDQIKQDEADLMAEQLAALTLATQATAAGQQTTVTAAESPTEVKARADAMGVLIRAGVKPIDAAAQVGLTDVEFTGATPTSLRLPEAQAADLEDK